MLITRVLNGTSKFNLKLIIYKGKQGEHVKKITMYK